MSSPMTDALASRRQLHRSRTLCCGCCCCRSLLASLPRRRPSRLAVQVRGHRRARCRRPSSPQRRHARPRRRPPEGAARSSGRHRAGRAGHPGRPLALRQQGGRDVHRRHARTRSSASSRCCCPRPRPRAAVALRHAGHHLPASRRAQGRCPKSAELFVVSGDESYRILRRADGASERLFARGAAQPVHRAGRARDCSTRRCGS